MTRALRAAYWAALLSVCGGGRSEAQPATSAAPLIVVETSKGSFAIRTLPQEAPVTVEHLLGLVRQGFYDGQRVHRAQAGFLVQFGDPRSRDVTRRQLWGRGEDAGSGKPVGVAEIGRKLSHGKGAVGMAHMGVPAHADSQIYIMLEPHPELDGRYAIVGQVVAGDDVPSRLQVGDVITRMSVRE